MSKYILLLTFLIFVNACANLQFSTTELNDNVDYIYLPKNELSSKKCDVLRSQYKIDRDKFITSGENVEKLVACDYSSKVIVIDKSKKNEPQYSIMTSNDALEHKNKHNIDTKVCKAEFSKALTSDISKLFKPRNNQYYSSSGNTMTGKTNFDTGIGGCGIWAVAQINKSKENAPSITQNEYKVLGKKLGTTLGVTTFSAIAKYFANQGKCIDFKKFMGNCNEYQEITKALKSDCGVIMQFGTQLSSILNPNSPYFITDPVLHYEAIIASNTIRACKNHPSNDKRCTEYAGNKNCYAISNSWGRDAVISGGSKGFFSHSNPSHIAGEHSPWPQNSTDVFVAYICKCNVYNPIGKDLTLFLQQQK